MKCNELRELITAMVDNEISGKEGELLSQHLRECKNCREILEAEKELKSRLSRIFKEKKVAEELKEEISRMINERTTTFPSLVVRRFPRTLIAGISTAVLAVLLFYLVTIYYSPQKLFPEKLLKYGEGLIIDIKKGTAKIEKPTSEPKELEEYFKKHDKITFEVPVPDMNTEGYKLIGGGVESINSIAVAVTIYKNNGEIVLNLMFDGNGFEGAEFGEEIEKSGMEFYVTSHHGVNCVAWWMGDELCIALSTLPQEKLIEFVMAGG
jgi:anti-sigma factor RsiW